MEQFTSIIFVMAVAVFVIFIVSRVQKSFNGTMEIGTLSVVLSIGTIASILTDATIPKDSLMTPLLVAFAIFMFTMVAIIRNLTKGNTY